MEIIKLGFICIVGILLAVPLKSYKAEYGVYMGIAVCIVVFGYAAQYFAGILSAMEQLRGYVEDNYSYLTVLLKAVVLKQEPNPTDVEYFRVFTDLIDERRETLRKLIEELNNL